MSGTVVVVDYGMGNRRSVEKALAHVGARVTISRDRREIEAAERLVLPGVGAFPRAMEHLRASGLGPLLHERAAAGVPLLGVCLGMQLLFDSSTELGGAEGLGLLPGAVTELDPQGGKLPHIGWNVVAMRRPAALTAGLPVGTPFYHVHSFACRPAEVGDVVGETTYGETVATIVERGNVAGVQFHPEKSSRDGLALLANWLTLVPLGALGAAA